MATKAQLVADAIVVRDETTTNANTATRVGTLHKDTIESMLNAEGTTPLTAAFPMASNPLVERSFTRIAPAAIGVNQTDYSPGGFPTCDWLIQAVTTNVDINSFAKPVAGSNHEFVIVNPDGTGNITLKHNSGAGAADNDMDLPNAADLVIGNRQAARFRYDFVLTKWRLVAVTAGAADANAIHDNVAGEYTGVPTAKAYINGDDKFLIEDAEDSDNKKSADATAISRVGADAVAAAVDRVFDFWWVGDDSAEVGTGQLNGIFARTGEQVWNDSGNPLSRIHEWGWGKASVQLTNDNISAVDPGLSGKHNGVGPDHTFVTVAAIKLNAGGAGTDRCIFCVSDGGSVNTKKVLRINTSDQLEYQSVDDGGTLRDDLNSGGVTVPVEQPLIIALLHLGSGGDIVAMMKTLDAEVTMFDAASSAAGTFDNFDRLSFGNAPGLTPDEDLNGHVRALGLLNEDSITKQRLAHLIRVVESSVAPLGGIVLPPRDAGDAPAAITESTAMWVAASGQPFYQDANGNIVGL